MVYSKINDSGYNKNKFAKLLGLRKFADELKSHVNKDAHWTAMTAASGVKERFEKLSSTLTYGFDNQRIQRVQHNHEILMWVVKKKELCGKYCIAFRGHREKIATN